MKLFFTILVIAFFCISLSGQTTRYVRVETPLTPEAPELISAAGIAIDYIGDEKIILEISENELPLLSETGLSFEITIQDLTSFYRQRNEGKDFDQILEDFRNNENYAVPQGFTLGSMGGFCTYGEMLAHLDSMAAQFPHLIMQRDTIPGGVSIEGRPIYWTRISNNPQITQEKPRVLYTGLTHAREPGSMQQMLFFMYYLLENYDSDAEVSRLVDNTELYFVPCMNPDGYIYIETTNPNGGGMWRKNRRDNGNGTMGVDLNRNYGYNWGFNNFGSSPNPASNTYRGTGPFSEPETQLIKTFSETYEFSVALHHHTYGDMLLHPWGYVSFLSTPHHDLFQEYGNLMTKENNYLYGVPGVLLYVVNGDAGDWGYGEQETKPMCMTFIPELGSQQDGFWPPVERIIPQGQESLHQNMMAAKLAGFYANLYDLSSENFATQSGWLHYGVKRLGMSDQPFEVAISPVGDQFLLIEAAKSFASSAQMQVVTDSAQYILKPDVRPGDIIKYTLTISSDGFTLTDTITKIYGRGVELFFDDCSDMNNWVSDRWNVSSERFFSPPFSIGNAPVSFYPNNDSSQVILAQPVDLTNFQCAWMSFYMSYDLNGGRDYVKLQASTDGGQTWTPLRGRLAETQFIPGKPDIPVYRGRQDAWIKERVSLRQFCGNEVLIGFWFRSDGAIGRAGFYFDDVKIEGLNMEAITRNIEINSGWNNLSGFIIPENDSLTVVFQNNASQLIILKNQDGFFAPGAAGSSLVTWNETSGYFIKAGDSFTLQLTGMEQNAHILHLSQGWNLIPVLSGDAIPVAKLTTSPPGLIEVIKEANGVKTMWPDQQINTLTELKPKRAYLIKMKESGLLKFNHND